MLAAVEQLLGAILVLDLEVVVSEVDLVIPERQTLPPHLQRLLARHLDDLHAELLTTKRGQDDVANLLPLGERPQLGRQWWRYRVDLEPTIPSFKRMVREAEDGDADADRSWAKARAALRSARSMPAEMAPMPDAFAFELGREAYADCDEEAAR